MKNLRHQHDTEDVEQIVIQWLERQPLVEFAILFGSFARETSNAGSDIDIAVELDQPLTPDLKLSMLQSFSELTDRKIDLIDLKTVGEPLLSQIVKYGKVVKGTDEDFLRLSIKNLNMMQDFTPYLQRLLKERRARLLNG